MSKKSVAFKPVKKTLEIHTHRKSEGKVVQYSFKGDYKKSEIKEYTQEFSDGLKKEGFKGSIEVALKYPENWRSGYFSNAGDAVRMYEYSDSDNQVNQEPNKFKEFAVYVMGAPTKGGGYDNFKNDCFWNCLQLVLLEKNYWKTPESLKHFLKLGRNDTVDISLIQKIDDFMKNHKINVEGDYIYTSAKKCQMEINIILSDGHYTLKKINTTNNLYYNIKEKLPVIFDSTYSDEEIKTYDGNEFKLMKISEFRKERTHFIKSKYIFIPKERNETFENCYITFVSEANLLKEKTNGVINLFKTGSNKSTALNLFNKFSKSIIPEVIDQTEGNWLMSATSGAMIWARKYTGPAYKYDVKSMYPFLLQNAYFLIPIKRGNFLILTDSNPKFFNYGIYRAVVNNTKPDLFKTNQRDYYTHIDLNWAKTIGLEINLICDGNVNALLYDREKVINAHMVFRDFVNILFELKENHPDVKNISKKLLNILWGSLSEKNIVKYRYDFNGPPVKLNENESIISIKPLSENRTEIEAIRNQKVFKYDYARIMPFLIAKGREMINKIMLPNIDHIKRVHTDGIISSIKLDLKVGKQLGDMVYEGYCDECNIENVNNVSKNFIV
jgi:hypothetical protein